MDWDGSGLNGDFSTSFAGHEEMLHMGSLMLAGEGLVDVHPG